MKFIGRVDEVKKIGDLLKEPGYSGCLVYGRRRLGKTELLRHCLVGKKAKVVFYQCTQSGEKSNTADLAKVICSSLSLSNLSFSSFSEAVSFVFQAAEKQEIYFLIDEYPYIKESVKGLDSEIQRLIDAFRSSVSLKFFLCGSSISTMESFMHEGSPLFRRFSSSILLKEMDYYDSSLFYPSFSSEDKVRLYAVFGGSPYFNRRIKETLSVKENIIALCSGDYQALEAQIVVGLKSELGKIDNANQVFSAIAEGAFHFSDIFAHSGLFSTPILSEALTRLRAMDLVDYIAPINDNQNKKKAGYLISDAVARFYYRYIFRHESSLTLLSQQTYYDRFIDADFESSLVPLTFEKIAKQYLIRRNRTDRLTPQLEEIGTYWYDLPSERHNGQFDVVGKTKGGYVLYEAKFTKAPIGDMTVKHLVDQARVSGLPVVQYGFFSRSGFTLKKDYPYQFYSIDELFKVD